MRHCQRKLAANDGRYGIPFATEFHGHHEEDEEGEHHEEGEEEHDAAEELARVDLAFRRHNVRFTGGVRNLGSWMDGFELSLNYSDWNHDELEVAGDGDQAIGTTFENQLFSYRGVLTQRPVGRLTGSFGFHGTARRYEAVSEEALSPPVDQNTFALFALEEIAFERVQLQLGGRLVQPYKLRLNLTDLPCSHEILGCMPAVRTPEAPQGTCHCVPCDSAFPLERQGRLLQPRSISGLSFRSLVFRPTPSLSTLRSVRHRPPRKTRYVAAG